MWIFLNAHTFERYQFIKFLASTSCNLFPYSFQLTDRVSIRNKDWWSRAMRMKLSSLSYCFPSVVFIRIFLLHNFRYWFAAKEFQLLEKMNISKICAAIIRQHNNLTLSKSMSNWIFNVLLEMRIVYSVLWMRVMAS